MKKCGAKPNLDTFVQLARAIEVAQETQRNNPTPPSAAHIIKILEDMDVIPDWTQHSSVGVFFGVIKNTMILNKNLPETTVNQLISAAHKVWSKTTPVEGEKAYRGRTDEQTGYDIQ